MKKKNSQNKLVIDEGKLQVLLPGMLLSARELIIFGDSEWKEGDPKALYAGNMAAITIITAQCAELLLKYKRARGILL